MRVQVMMCAALALAGCDRQVREAERIAAKNIEARGGAEAWRAVETMALTGHLQAGVARDPVKLALAAQRTVAQAKAEQRRAALHDLATAPQQTELPFLLELARPHRSRLEVQFAGQTAVQVQDGKDGWKVRPFLGRQEVEPFTPAELAESSQEGYLDGPLLDAKRKGHELRLVGTGKVDGREAYDIQVTSADGAVRHVWVDQETSYDVRIDGTRRLNGKTRLVSTLQRDFKKVGALMVPHTYETMVDGVPGSEKIVVDRVSLGVELAADRFTRPN